MLVLLLGACGPAHVRIDPEASERRYQLGADLYSKRLVGPALEELLKAVELNPDNSQAHNLLGLVYLGKAVEAEDLSTRNQCLRGESLELEKKGYDADFAKADKEFREAIRIQPDYSEAYNNVAVVAQHFGKIDEAISAADKAMSNIVYHDPWMAQGNLGLAYFAKGDFVRAAAALRKALFDNPKFCVGRFRLAKVYFSQNELEHARDELDTMLADKACQSIQEAYHLAGLVALKMGDRERGHELFRSCVKLAPKSCLARECDFTP